MSERVDDPTFQDYSWPDNTRRTNDQGQGQTYGQEPNLGHPKPLFDYPEWTPWQREVNARAQHLFRGNFADAFAPSFSERFKPGFDPNSMPPSANPVLGLPFSGSGLIGMGMRMVAPFGYMAGAEDLLEKSLGKPIWHRDSPDEREEWWLRNHD